MKWRPIETAPEEGDILVWCPDAMGYMQVVNSGNYIGRLYGKAFCLENSEICPSHWRPLPEPPEAED